MATINDPTTGTTAKVSALGSLLVTTGDDGYPTYFAKVYHPRLTSAIGANNALWAIRAPVNRSVVIRGGMVKISMDVTLGTMAEVGVAMVRFLGADPAGGTVYTATNVRLVDPAPQITNIRGGGPTTALTMTAVGMVVDPSAQALFHLTVPGIAGSQATLDLSEWTGTELQPGEGLALYTGATAAPIGFTTSGWITFSEVA